jgi:hypothetical protein
MAVYLDEDMIGLNSDVIGFPNLLVCMGFVVLFEEPLGSISISGIHLTLQEKSKRTFPFFVEKFGKPAKVHAIYGCCNYNERYKGSANGRAEWDKEMASFAGQLGFNGPARGFDTSIVDPRDGTYVEYQAVNNFGSQPLKIFYKENEMMKYSEGGPTLARVALSDSKIPPSLADNPKVVAKLRDRTEDTLSKGNAKVRQKGFGKKKLNELDYALRLVEVNV